MRLGNEKVVEMDFRYHSGESRESDGTHHL